MKTKEELKREFLRKKQILDNRRETTRRAWQRKRMVKKMRYRKYYNKDFDYDLYKKIKKETTKRMNKITLRKQYSKKYQVVEVGIEMNVNPDDDINELYDFGADFLDKQIQKEIEAIPQELLNDDSRGGSQKTQYGNKKQYGNKQQYGGKKKQYGNKRKSTKVSDEANMLAEQMGFGTPKQWNTFLDDRSQEKLEEEGYPTSPNEVEGYEHLQEIIGFIING